MSLQIRKRDVVLNLEYRGNRPVPPGISVRIEQTSRNFPLGSCISRWNLDNSSYKEFFLQNFNWAVFENEIKWNWTEPQRGTVSAFSNPDYVLTSVRIMSSYTLGVRKSKDFDWLSQ